MVSQEVVGEHQSTIDIMKADIKAKAAVHRDLIYRYTMLKQAIDTAWGKFEVF
jgi:hypothetical protein